MNHPFSETTRVLAIDPTSKGIGFAVLEGPRQLVAWGVKHAAANRECLQRATALIHQYQPDALVVERTDVRGCRRRPRALELIGDILDLSKGRRVRARWVSRREMLRHFAMSGFATKRDVAVALSVRFPELCRYLPPERKPWMSEDERMSIFDALAFGLAFYKSLRRQRQALALLPEEISPHHA
jgi:hypothetical protein